MKYTTHFIIDVWKCKMNGWFPSIQSPAIKTFVFCLFFVYICFKQIDMDFNINQRFEFLTSLTSMVVTGVTPSLILVGEGGLGKSYTVTKTIQNTGLENKDYIFFKGYSTPRGLYNALYDNNGKLIIFDDCDSVLEDKVSQNILKSALDSYERRTISWMAKMNKNDEYPQQFDFTGRIIFISNMNKSKVDTAILSRSLVVDLSMSQSEKIERMQYIIDDILPEYSIEIKQDALDFLETNKERSSISLRSLIMVSKIRYSYPDNWSDLASYMLHS